MADTQMLGRDNWQAWAFSAGAIVIAGLAGFIFLEAQRPEPFVPGPGVTEQHMLSQIEPAVLGSPGDTPVFEMEGATPGGTFMIMGGTHPQEIAGLIAATIVIENATVRQGKLVVVPQSNRSGYTHTDPLEGFPHTFGITSDDGGVRWFRNGMRLANPAHQWPDPDVYVHRLSGEELVGVEARNFNRQHPGTPAGVGSMLSQVSGAFVKLIQDEGADILIDMHEAQPEYPVINKVIYHQRAADLAGTAQFYMGDDGVTVTADPSPRNLHGLSHREFGDYTMVQALLHETANPSMGRLRGRTDENLVVNGRDDNYLAASKLPGPGGPYGSLFVPWTEAGWPLVVRVARQISGIRAIIQAYNDLNGGTDQILVDGIPTYQEILDNGLGHYLRSPPTGFPRPLE